VDVVRDCLVKCAKMFFRWFLSEGRLGVLYPRNLRPHEASLARGERLVARKAPNGLGDRRSGRGTPGPVHRQHHGNASFLG
jgi:hypothetical protein